MTEQQRTTGDRIRAWRRRRGGMSQKALADLSGLSQSYISAIESGDRPLDRKTTQVAIATALNISVAQLLDDPHAPADPLRDRAVAHVPTIRAALIDLRAGEHRPAVRDVDATVSAVRQLTELRNAADYAAVAPALPGLLGDLAAHNGAVGAELVETLFAARYALKTMGYPDLAREAADLGVRAAEQYGDLAWRAQASYSWVQSFPAESAELGAKVMTRTADELQAAPDRPAQEMYGCTHILAGFEAAVAGRADEAWSHLDEAADVAASLGEPERYGPLSAGINANWFGPTQVLIWRVAVAAELADAGAALAAAERIDLDSMPVPNRWVYLHTDLARVQAATGQPGEALKSLAAAERAAPQHFRWNPVVRDLVRSLLTQAQRRAVTADLQGMARTLGLSPL